MDKNEVASVAYRYVDLSLMPRFGKGAGCQRDTEAKQVRSVIDRSFTMRGIPGRPHSEQIEGERILVSACMDLEENKGQK